jgi:hypothetical protein
MRILLVEPAYRRVSLEKTLAPGDGLETERKVNSSDDTLWYPPLGLMKLARFHKQRGDEVHFVSGIDRSIMVDGDTFAPERLWDRVYITTLFTFHFDKVVETINYYKDAVGGTTGKVFVGGVMASMMPKEVFEATGIYPIFGALNSPKQLGLDGNENIDLLPPDYSILNHQIYGVNDTYYWYASRGCVLKCAWCAVPKIEPVYEQYYEIKNVILKLREEYGDKRNLKLMDNNIMASDDLKKTVDDLLELGYGRGNNRGRTIDFNQGLDATYFTDEKLKIFSQLNISPVRIAFDRVAELPNYKRAVELAYKHGFTDFSNYMLYNWKDTPDDLFKRIHINIELNEQMRGENGQKRGKVYCYPMRYAPIDEKRGKDANKQRDFMEPLPAAKIDWYKETKWTKRFIRNIEIMKGVANGAISTTPSLARRTVGNTWDEFLTNLYMPEELLRNRNKHEAKVHREDLENRPGTGQIEDFRHFILKLIKTQDVRFQEFHEAVTPNSVKVVREAILKSNDPEIKQWLSLYLRK